MPLYHYHFETDVDFRHPVSRHCFMLRCLPKECLCQHVISSRYEVRDATWLSEGHDAFGNRVVYGSADEPHTHFSIVGDGILALRHYSMYDAPMPCYHSPSPLTMASPEMRSMIYGVLKGAKATTATDKAMLLCHAVHAHLEYKSRVTGSHTTAAEAFYLGAGVCQDYSHILIALCREAGIAARYVSGLVPGEGASHAWVEVYDRSRWVGIDPTNDCLARDGYIIMAHGRDADDCPLNRGIYTGLTDELMTVRVMVELL